MKDSSYKNNVPITKRLTASLYVPQFSPTAALSAVYNGSRSMRGGTWFDFDILGAEGGTMLSAFGGRIGVEDVRDGLLRAAGSMSGMTGVRRLGGARRAKVLYVAWGGGLANLWAH